MNIPPYKPGDRVITRFYPDQVDEILIVRLVEEDDYCESGWMVRTECGLNADSGWFMKVEEDEFRVGRC